ncbi:hypothetical protein [Paucilactobacillus hokkaidonensis]|nr:hypothetical protein [Paucilactobacillus hokkaidonensis]
MAFSIPTMINHHQFIYRDQIILVAAIVILISLSVPAIIFPLVLPTKQKSYSAEQLDHHVAQLVSYAVTELKQSNQPSEEVRQVSETLASQAKASQFINRKRFFEIANQTRQVEQDAIEKLSDSGEISSKTQAYYERFIERSAFQSSHRSFWKVLWHRFKHGIQRKLAHPRKNRISTEAMKQRRHEFLNKNAATIEVLGHVSVAAISYLDSIETAENRAEVAALRRTYTSRTRFASEHKTLDDDLLQRLFIQAFQFEHTYVQQQVAVQNITQELANHLNEKISTDELVYMQSMA